MILLSTASLQGYGIHKIFDIAQKSQYDGLDVHINGTSYDVLDKVYMKNLIHEFHIPIVSMTVSMKGLNESKIDEIISLAKALDVQVITFSPPHFGDKNVEWFTKYLGKIKQHLNITIAVQNVESKFRFFIIPEYKNVTLSEIKKITGSTALDLSFVDSASGMDIIKAQKNLGVSLKNVFLNDKF